MLQPRSVKILGEGTNCKGLEQSYGTTNDTAVQSIALFRLHDKLISLLNLNTKLGTIRQIRTVLFRNNTRGFLCSEVYYKVNMV